MDLGSLRLALHHEEPLNTTTKYTNVITFDEFNPTADNIPALKRKIFGRVPKFVNQPLLYKDNENDWILLENDEDWKQAIALWGQMRTLHIKCSSAGVDASTDSDQQSQEIPNDLEALASISRVVTQIKGDLKREVNEEMAGLVSSQRSQFSSQLDEQKERLTLVHRELLAEINQIKNDMKVKRKAKHKYSKMQSEDKKEKKNKEEEASGAGGSGTAEWRQIFDQSVQEIQRKTANKQQASVNEIDACLRCAAPKLNSPTYHCLSPCCGQVLCGGCVESHDPNHVVIRVPANGLQLTSGTRHALCVSARAILREAEGKSRGEANTKTPVQQRTVPIIPNPCAHRLLIPPAPLMPVPPAPPMPIPPAPPLPPLLPLQPLQMPLGGVGRGKPLGALGVSNPATNIGQLFGGVRGANSSANKGFADFGGVNGPPRRSFGGASQKGYGDFGGFNGQRVNALGGVGRGKSLLEQNTNQCAANREFAHRQTEADRAFANYAEFHYSPGFGPPVDVSLLDDDCFPIVNEDSEFSVHDNWVDFVASQTHVNQGPIDLPLYPQLAKEKKQSLPIRSKKEEANPKKESGTKKQETNQEEKDRKQDNEKVQKEDPLLTSAAVEEDDISFVDTVEDPDFELVSNATNQSKSADDSEYNVVDSPKCESFGSSINDFIDGELDFEMTAPEMWESTNGEHDWMSNSASTIVRDDQAAAADIEVTRLLNNAKKQSFTSKLESPEFAAATLAAIKADATLPNKDTNETPVLVIDDKTKPDLKKTEQRQQGAGQPQEQEQQQQQKQPQQQENQQQQQEQAQQQQLQEQPQRQQGQANTETQPQVVLDSWLQAQVLRLVDQTLPAVGRTIQNQLNGVAQTLSSSTSASSVATSHTTTTTTNNNNNSGSNQSNSNNNQTNNNNNKWIPPHHWNPPPPAQQAWVPRGTQTEWVPPPQWQPQQLDSASDYATGHQKLIDMGFNDVHMNEHVLRRNNGDVEKTVDELLGLFQMANLD